MNIQIDRKTNREVQEPSKRSDVPNVGLVQGLIQAVLGVFRLAPHDTPIELASELYRPEVALAELRRFDPEEVDEVKRERLQAMELATVMG